MTITKNTMLFLFWALVLLAGFLVHGSSGHDDPHINFWFSHTLLEYGQMLNYNGDRVEQTTSLLLVLLTALFSWMLPFDLVTCGYLVDIASAFACCWLVTVLARQLVPAWAVWPSCLMLSSISFLLWTFGGMGAVLAAFCLLAAAATWWSFVETPQLHAKHWAALLAVSVSLVLVRPEMPLVIVVCAAFLLVLHANDKTRRRRFLYVLLVGLLCSVLLFVWQKWYFSSWLPLPVLAKQAGSRSLLAKLDFGLFYLTLNSIANPVILLSLFSVPFIAWMLFRRNAGAVPQRMLTMLLVLVTLVGAYCGFVLSVGGDWMQGGRFLVPVIPAAALLVVLVLASLLQRRWLIRLLLVAPMAASLAFIPVWVARESHGIPAWVQYRLDPVHAHYSVFEKYNQEHLRDMAVIDHLQQVLPALHQKLGRPVRLLSGQAGMVFYTLGTTLYGQVEFTDLRGLVEGTYTQCPFLVNAERNAMGLSWDYTQYFSVLPSLEMHCNVQRPDVIYDLDSPFYEMEAVISRSGYSLIHRETGFVISNNTTILANSLYAPNRVFVRNDLVPLLDNPEKTVVDYQRIPLLDRY